MYSLHSLSAWEFENFNDLDFEAFIHMWPIYCFNLKTFTPVFLHADTSRIHDSHRHTPKSPHTKKEVSTFIKVNCGRMCGQLPQSRENIDFPALAYMNGLSHTDTTKLATSPTSTCWLSKSHAHCPQHPQGLCRPQHQQATWIAPHHRG